MGVVAAPSSKVVKDLLDGLLARDVRVTWGNPVQNADSAVFAVYVNDLMRMSAIVSLDLAGAAYLGTSFSLIPVTVAQDAIHDRYLPDNVYANLGRFLDRFAAVLGRRYRLYTVYRGAAPAPRDAMVVAASLGHRLDLTITVDRYGAGRMSCVVC